MKKQTTFLTQKRMKQLQTVVAGQLFYIPSGHSFFKVQLIDELP